MACSKKPRKTRVYVSNEFAQLVNKRITMENTYSTNLITKQDLWEGFLQNFEHTSMFLSWEYFVFLNKINKKTERLGIFDQNGNLVGILPITYVYARRGRYLHLRHGPLFDWDNKKLISFTIDFLKQKAKAEHMWFIRMSPLLLRNPKNQALLSSLKLQDATTHETDAERTVIIDLTQSENKILANMRKNTRYDIRKAKRLGMKVKHSADTKFLDLFEKIHQDTRKRQGWTGYSMNYIRTEYETYAKIGVKSSTNDKEKNGKARIFVVFYKGQAIAASIFITEGNQVMYHYSGSLTKYRNVPSTHLLHWEAIKFYKSQGFKLYNFWGVCPKDAKNHPWSGLSRFKRGFTNNELLFVHAKDLIVSPLAYPQRIYEWLIAKLRGYR